jgi:hypothetical protein
VIFFFDNQTAALTSPHLMFSLPLFFVRQKPMSSPPSVATNGGPPSRASLSRLPPALHVYILEFCAPSTVAVHVRRLSRSWSVLAASDTLWRSLFTRRYAIAFGSRLRTAPSPAAAAPVASAKADEEKALKAAALSWEPARTPLATNAELSLLPKDVRAIDLFRAWPMARERAPTAASAPAPKDKGGASAAAAVSATDAAADAKAAAAAAATPSPAPAASKPPSKSAARRQRKKANRNKQNGNGADDAEDDADATAPAAAAPAPAPVPVPAPAPSAAAAAADSKGTPSAAAAGARAVSLLPVCLLCRAPRLRMLLSGRLHRICCMSCGSAYIGCATCYGGIERSRLPPPPSGSGSGNGSGSSGAAARGGQDCGQCACVQCGVLSCGRDPCGLTYRTTTTTAAPAVAMATGTGSGGAPIASAAASSDAKRSAPLHVPLARTASSGQLSLRSGDVLCGGCGYRCGSAVCGHSVHMRDGSGCERCDYCQSAAYCPACWGAVGFCSPDCRCPMCRSEKHTAQSLAAAFRKGGKRAKGTGGRTAKGQTSATKRSQIDDDGDDGAGAADYYDDADEYD